MSPVTTWTNERAPGNPWEYNEAEMTYNQSTKDGLPVLYNSLGEETAWTNEAI